MYTNTLALVTVFMICYLSASVCPKSNTQKFQIEYQWSLVNFTWENEKVYNDAIATKRYILGNTAPAGIKVYKNKFYIAMPRICEGVPVTLGYICTSEDTLQTNPLVRPFPDWETNDLRNHSCEKLENVQSMEIDKDGTMWVLDGFRGTPDAKCPPKLALYDLNNNTFVHSFNFPEEISLSKGGFLNDLVIDDRDGGFAYITDHSVIDPGLVVYSRVQNRAWKLRDSSMFPEFRASSFEVDNVVFDKLVPIDGIALSPASHPGPRYVYYCTLAGLNLYAISTDILKNEEIVNGGDWRANVSLIGLKQAQSDGMVVDNTGILYYGLLPLYGVGKWNTNASFATKDIVDQNRSTMVWTDSFGFDDQGYLYLLANNIHKYFMSRCNFSAKDDSIKFRILKYFTGTKSYLF